MKMEELDSFQRRGCFLRKGGEEFRAREKPRSGACVQGAGTRCDPNVSTFLLQKEISLVNLSFIFGFPLAGGGELDVAGPLTGAEQTPQCVPVTDHSSPAACSLPAVPCLQSTGKIITTP